MFKFIYYFIGIIYLFYELSWVVSPREKTKKHLERLKVYEILKSKNWDRCNEIERDACKHALFIIFYALWLAIGIFTFQWVLFVVFLLFEIIINAPIGKLLKPSWAYTVWMWINSVMGFVFILFAIINAYHLKIDLFQLIKSIT